MLLSNGATNADEKKKGFYEDFKEFTTETTSHGIQYVFNAAYQWVRLIYLILWLAAVVYTIFIVFISVGKYISMETGTKIEELVKTTNKDTNKDAITHPTVTVCPHNIVSKAFLNANDDLEDLLHMIRTTDPYDLSWNTSHAKYENWTYHDIMWKGRPRIGLLFCEHYRHMCASKEEFANRTREPYHWDPDYDILSHDASFDWEVSLSGSCYRINPKGSLLTQVGDYGVLKLTFFTDLNDYSKFSKKDPMYGYTVVFHDNGTYSSTMTSGFYMSPGNVYKADMRKYKEFNIGPPYGRCNPHLKNNVYGTYSSSSCIARCRDQYVKDMCGCIQILPPHPEYEPELDFRGCTLKEWVECGARATLNFTDRFVDLKEEAMCECTPACMETWYDATISSSRLSKFYANDKAISIDGQPAQLARIVDGYGLNHGIEETYNISKETVYENLMVLQVLFTSIQESNYKEYVKYDYTQLIGDVGGQMGMLLGASLFTIIEFVHFFIKVAWRYCVKKAARRAGEGGALERPAYEMHRDQVEE